MKRPHTVNYLYNGTSKNGLGHISVAATIQDSSGTPGNAMRKLGCYAVVYIYEGNGNYQDTRISHRMQAGDFIIIFPDELHKYKPGPDDHWNDFYLLFEGPIFDLWRKEKILSPDRLIMNLQPISLWKNRLKEVYELSNDPLDQICRLQNLLSDAFKHDRYTIVEEENNTWKEEAESLLKQNFLVPECIQKTAAEMGMSYESFRKKYKRICGIPPNDFRSAQIMEAASRILAETDDPILQIADQLGFCDEFHFARRFKKVIGLTPATYRKRLHSVGAPAGALNKK